MATETEVPAKSEEEKPTEVKDYLVGPRRKRKDYVILALSPDFDKDLSRGIDGFIRKTFPQYSILMVKSVAELQKLFNRQIMILIIDDKFATIKGNIEIILALKQKKATEPLPVCFLTEDQDQLVKNYNESLITYQEVDSYFDFRKRAPNHIYARINTMLTTKNARRSRRFQTHIAVDYFDVGSKDIRKGMLFELSMHGGVLVAHTNLLFKEGEQLRVRIHKGKYLPPKYGDFLNLAAKVRRVFLSGHKCAVSWEFLNESQVIFLTDFLSSYVNHNVKHLP